MEVLDNGGEPLRSSAVFNGGSGESEFRVTFSFSVRGYGQTSGERSAVEAMRVRLERALGAVLSLPEGSFELVLSGLVVDSKDGPSL